MKADLAIYSLIVGMSGQWENVATMLNWISVVVTIRSVFANAVTYKCNDYSHVRSRDPGNGY